MKFFLIFSIVLIIAGLAQCALTKAQKLKIVLDAQGKEYVIPGVKHDPTKQYLTKEQIDEVMKLYMDPEIEDELAILLTVPPYLKGAPDQSGISLLNH